MGTRVNLGPTVTSSKIQTSIYRERKVLSRWSIPFWICLIATVNMNNGDIVTTASSAGISASLLYNSRILFVCHVHDVTFCLCFSDNFYLTSNVKNKNWSVDRDNIFVSVMASFFFSFLTSFLLTSYHNLRLCCIDACSVSRLRFGNVRFLHHSWFFLPL